MFSLTRGGGGGATVTSAYLLPCTLNPIALRKTKIVYNFGLSECGRVKGNNFLLRKHFFQSRACDSLQEQALLGHVEICSVFFMFGHSITSIVQTLITDIIFTSNIKLLYAVFILKIPTCFQNNVSTQKRYSKYKLVSSNSPTLRLWSINNSQSLCSEHCTEISFKHYQYFIRYNVDTSKPF